METGRSFAGLRMSCKAVVMEDGRIREEVVNSIARQIMTLKKERCEVFIFIPDSGEYCREYCRSRVLRSALGKVGIEKTFKNAFARRSLKICLLDPDEERIGNAVKEAFQMGMVPIVTGIAEGTAAGLPEIPERCEGSFISICKAVGAEVAVSVHAGDETGASRTRDHASCYGGVRQVYVRYSCPDFLTDAVDPEPNPKYGLT